MTTTNDSIATVIKDLMHSRKVDGYSGEQLAFLLAVCIRLEWLIPVVDGGAATQKAEDGKVFEGYLCRAWGESDSPVLEIVADMAGIREFLVREWLGDAAEADDVMVEVEAYEWKDEPPWSAGFEIGGISVEKVRGYVDAAAFADRSARAGAPSASGEAAS